MPRAVMRWRACALGLVGLRVGCVLVIRVRGVDNHSGLHANAEREVRQQRVLDGEWRAAISEGGETYYWHTRTRETTWEKPEEMAKQDAQREADVERWEQLAKGGKSSAPPSDGEGRSTEETK